MRLLFIILSLPFASLSYGSDIYLDKGGCPGEGCSYNQEWISIKNINIFELPKVDSTVISTLSKNEIVKTITGEVHTIPGVFDVKRKNGKFNLGDEVLVYTYLGEGWFKIRHNGKITTASLDFSPWGGSSGKRCDIDKQCWGTLKDNLEFTWWVKVSTKTGLEGWINDSGSFTMPRHH